MAKQSLKTISRTAEAFYTYAYGYTASHEQKAQTLSQAKELSARQTRVDELEATLNGLTRWHFKQRKDINTRIGQLTSDEAFQRDKSRVERAQADYDKQVEDAKQHYLEHEEEYKDIAAIDAYMDGVHLNIDHPLHGLDETLPSPEV